MKQFVALLAILIWSSALHAADKIPIKTIERIGGGATTAPLSFDGDAGTSWFEGWSQATYPVRVRVTFHDTYAVKKIRILDGMGVPTLIFYASDIAAAPILTVQLDRWNEWRSYNIDALTNHFVIELGWPQGNFPCPEIEFYGADDGVVDPPVIVDPNPGPPTTTPISLTLTGDAAKIGACGFHWVPFDLLPGVITKKRDFQMASWTWRADGLAADPLAQAQSATVQGYDAYYELARQKGIEIVPCINETPDWFWNQPAMAPATYSYDRQTPRAWYDPKKYERQMRQLNTTGRPITYSNLKHPKHPPARDGRPRQEPTSYREYAEFMFQWAARYGSTPHPDDALLVSAAPAWPGGPAVSRVKKSGLGLIKTIEPWNEPDAWWLQYPTYWNPEEFCAFLSAVYDGHCGTMGAGVGIKNADPNMQVLMPGLTGPDKAYLERMVTWAKANRPDKRLPWDITNFHHYSNKGNDGRWPPTWNEGAPTDRDGSWHNVQAFVSYAKSLKKPIWITEFGYDSRPPSWQYAVPYGPFTSETLQAAWLMRAYLDYIRVGIDQAMMFNLIDEHGAANGGLYMNTGLLYGEGAGALKFTPKPAYTGVAWLAQELNGYTFESDVSLPDVKIYQFRKGRDCKAFVWMPTVSGSSRTITFAGKTITATEIPQVISYKKLLVNPRNQSINRVLIPKRVPRYVE